LTNKNKQMITRNKEKRSKVLQLILKSPGIRYRQLLRLTGLSNGSLSFALKKLEKSKDIIVNRTSNNRATGYYPKNITTTEFHIISNLRNETQKRIVQFLLMQGQSTFYDIVNYTNRAPSTTSWHLNKLKNAELITSNSHHGRPRPYKIRNRKSVAKIISKY
jgi:predicted transcriptional regulator